MRTLDSEPWNQLIANLPNTHLLQTWEWGQVKARLGWVPIYLIWSGTGNQLSILNSPPSAPPSASIAAAALVLQRTIQISGFAARMRVLYIPKGPLLVWDNTVLRRRVLDDLHTFARRQGGIFIKIDPDVLLGSGVPGTSEAQEDPVGHAVTADLHGRGWHFSEEQIQFRNTVLIDLTPAEDELLAHMKQKMRYNIRLAERKGVTVRVGTSADFSMLYRMYAETSVRDGFVIRDERYYRNVWESFAGSAEPLIAEVDGEPVAAVYIFSFAGKAIYLYGMSREAHREKMPNALLQWEAMRRAKAAGCTVYDLWGAPDEFNEDDSMWGVFRFKEGLGGRVVRTIGAWDLPVNRILYRLYTQTLPHLLALLRRRSKTRTQQMIG